MITYVKEMHCSLENNSTQDTENPAFIKVSTEGQFLNCITSSMATNTLDLSRKNLHHLSEDFYKNSPNLQNLYLKGNFLRGIPENLFRQLQHLVWLDLRHNQITSLPSTVGELRHLKYFLLEGNPIRALPVELGDVSTLKALNLRHCPLEFPPESIVHKGLESILSFLRNARGGNDLLSEPDETKMPVVEKLKLNELKSSLEMTEEWENNEERMHFEMLKNKIKQKEMEEMAQGDTLCLPPIHQRAHSQMWKERGSFITELRCAVPTQESKTRVHRHVDEKETLAVINQKHRDQEILKNWQNQTKLMKEKKERNKEKNDHEVPTAVAPYATDLDVYQKGDSCDKQKLVVEKQELKSRVKSAKSLLQLEKERTSRNQRLESRIRQHIQSMQDRKRNPQGTAQEAMEAAKYDLEMASLLQAELLLQKKEQGNLEYRFTAFTGEMSPRHSVERKPLNLLTFS